MAAQATDPRRDIAAFCAELRRVGIRPRRIILFGSWAAGQERWDSDIDVIVVSQDFRGKGLRRRLELLGIAAAGALVPVQALGYTPEEIAAPEPQSFLAMILSEKTVEMPINHQTGKSKRQVARGKHVKKLERIAPARSRRRSAFIRAAIPKTIGAEQQRETAEAYRRLPDSADDAWFDPRVWEPKPPAYRGRRRR